jgi:hypothetical protein
MRRACRACTFRSGKDSGCRAACREGRHARHSLPSARLGALPLITLARSSRLQGWHPTAKRWRAITRPCRLSLLSPGPADVVFVLTSSVACSPLHPSRRCRRTERAGDGERAARSPNCALARAPFHNHKSDHRSDDWLCFARSPMMVASGLSVGASTSCKVFVS